MTSSGSRSRLTLITFQEINLPPNFTSDFLSEFIKLLESTDLTREIYHFQRVTIIANLIGKELNLPDDKLKELFFASLLHDIGASSMNIDITDKLTSTPDIFGQKNDFSIFAHTARGYSIINRFPTLRNIAEIVKHHHEFFDGSGYPDGKKEFPLSSGIIRLADTFDILMRIHNFRTFEQADSFLRLSSGEEFDEKIYEKFSKLLKTTDLLNKIKNPQYVEKYFTALKQKMHDLFYFASTDTVNRFFEFVANTVDHATSDEKNHSIRVAEFAEQIAIQMGLKQTEILFIRWSAFLHDLGKLDYYRHLYKQKGKLSEEEWEIIKSHPEKSYKAINAVSGLQKVAYFVLYHHENFNGTGYPEGLAGKRIPLESRILRVADAFEAMTSERIYHRKKDWSMAIKELKKNSGKQFDPEIIDVFVKHIS